VVRHRSSLRKRALITAVAIALAATGAATPMALAADGGGDGNGTKGQLKDQQKQLQSGIRSATADLESSSTAAVKAQQQLLDARAQLGGAQQKLSATQQEQVAAQALDTQMQAALVQAQAQLVDAQAQLVAGRAAVVEQRAAVGRLAASSMQDADPHLVGMVALMQADDPAVLSSEMQTVGNVIDRQNNVLEDYRSAESRLVVQEHKVQQAKDTVAQQSKAAATNLQRRTALAQQAASDEQAVTRLITARAAAKKVADATRSHDKAELKKLKAENDRVAALLKKLAQKPTTYDNGGALMRPVDGYVTSPFGYRVHPIYGYYSLHDGTDFHAPCGTPLKAAGNGKVIEEYFQSAWGNRLIVDLGKIDGHGVSVIYNHLSAYKARTGDTVTRGETIGYAGTTGWSTGCHLHFTVMVDGVAKNPMDYF
jgi:murein DD-endopeptidase MepM/ murein hydrolase activator NlpD